MWEGRHRRGVQSFYRALNFSRSKFAKVLYIVTLHSKFIQQGTYFHKKKQRLVRSTRGFGVGEEEWNALLSRAHTKIATALLDLEKYTTQAQTL